MKPFKYFFLVFVAVSSLLIAGHFFVLSFIDPLNILPFDLSRNEFYVKEMRFQTAPLIRKFDFDSAIVGTSMAVNFDPFEANEKLGGNFQNLSLEGSLFNEREVVLDYLFEKKNVKTVIISLDGSTKIQRNKGIPIEAWDFLYNDNLLDDFAVYANQKYFPYLNCHSLFTGTVGRLLFGECPKDRIRKHIEELTEWQSLPYHNKRFGGVQMWLANRDNEQIRDSIKNILAASDLVTAKKTLPAEEQLHTYEPTEFSKHLKPFFAEHPETRFILYFPPYSIFRFAIDAQTQPDAFDSYKKFVESVVLETAPYKNVEVYWFNDEEFLAEIRNYKDLTHHHADFNTLFLNRFREHRSRITTQDYKEKISALEHRAMQVDLQTFANNFR